MNMSNVNHLEATNKNDTQTVIPSKEQLAALAKENGFQLFGISDIKKVEAYPYPDGRGLVKPSEVMPEAKTLLIMGVVIWDEGMNMSISKGGPADFGGGADDYFNLYYEVMETRAWRFCRAMADQYGMRGTPSVSVPLKPSAQLGGLGSIGRNTLVIAPEYGPRVRWVAVLTDTYLPPDAPFTRDLCTEQEKCKAFERCVKACPFSALEEGPITEQHIKNFNKLHYDSCGNAHIFDAELSGHFESHSRRVTQRGFLECTFCNVSCPYGREAVQALARKKRGTEKDLAKCYH